jgi:hypothetical protein
LASETSKLWPNRSIANSQGDAAMHVLVNGVRLFFDVEGNPSWREAAQNKTGARRRR